MRFSFYGSQNSGKFIGDLAAERRRANPNVRGVEFSEMRCPIGSWEQIKITTPAAEESIGRPIGHYDTLNTKRLDLFDFEDFDDAKNEVAWELCALFDRKRISPARLLVAGLGNAALTPDSVGPLAASMVMPTLHVSEGDAKMFSALECSEIAVVRPGVASESGLESSVMLRGVCEKIQPNAVIAIDALAASAPERLGTTIQFCDTGIFPGTGLGRGKSPLDEETLGVPVIAIGVPTVIDSRLFGNSEYSNMFVAPKDVDCIVDAAARVIAGGINQAFGIDF